MVDAQRRSFDSETGSFDLTGQWFGSSLGKSSVGATTCAGSGGPPGAAPSCYTGSKLSETVNLKVDTFASETGSFDFTGSVLESISCLGKSFTSVAPETLPADSEASEMLYQSAEIIGACKTLPGTLGLSALVVGAAPCDVRP